MKSDVKNEEQGWSTVIKPKDKFWSVDFKELWKYRCFPKTRANMRELVSDLPSGYNRFEIVRRTHGIMSDDCYWVRFDDEEDLCWDDVKG